MQQHNIINTQRKITAMKLNQAFLLIQYLYMGILHNLSLCFSSCSSMLMLNECYNDTKEGAYIPFSLSKEKLSNLQLIPI